MTTTTTSGVIYDMPETEYHARPELSSTGARAILDSPARYQWQQTHRTESRAFDIGHAVHAKILGVGSPIVVVPDEHLTQSGAVSTKAATVAWLTEQRAAGLVPIGASEATVIEAMAAAVLAHPAARTILEPADVEVSAFATDPATGVACRARFDVLGPVAADVKTTAGSASRKGFGRDAAKYSYPVQQAHYLDVLEWVTGERRPFRWVVVEKRPPHLVAVHQFDDVTAFIGAELAAQARRTYAECVATDTWPGYGDDVLTTLVPAWWGNTDDTDDIEIPA